MGCGDVAEERPGGPKPASKPAKARISDKYIDMSRELKTQSRRDQQINRMNQHFNEIHIPQQIRMKSESCKFDGEDAFRAGDIKSARTLFESGKKYQVFEIFESDNY